MSVGDRPIWFYQQGDVTDPTPWEEDDSLLEGEECMLCGREFRRGEAIMEMKHGTLNHDRFYFHEGCLKFWFKDRAQEILDAFGEFGFETEEWEET